MSDQPEHRTPSMGSVNHRIVQAKITGILLNDERFTPAIELNPDVSQIDLSQFGLKAKMDEIADIHLPIQKVFGW